MQGPYDELAHGDGVAFRKEWLHAEVRVNSRNPGSIYRAVGISRDGAVLYSFTSQSQGDGMFLLLGLGDGKIASAAQIGGNFIGEHFFQTEAEQVGRVPAIGPSHDVAASTRGTARTAVT